MNKRNAVSLLFALPVAVLLPVSALAQLVVSDTLTGPTSSFKWNPTGGACLTAGTATLTKTPLATGNSSLPACVGLPYYTTTKPTTLVGGATGTLPDVNGKGAMRLTNGGNGTNQAGAVYSTEPFPTNEGVQVTFSTATYGGNGSGGNGADGIVFMLLDGTKPARTKPGGVGGSLGYSCSNINDGYDGMVSAYVGVGIDEYGNFSNPGDNTASGPGFRKNYVGVRGAGNVNWAGLNAAYPTYYPSTYGDKEGAVKKTCATGFIQDFSGKGKAPIKVADYAMIGSPDYLQEPIANQQNASKPRRDAAKIITYDLRITQDNLLSLSYSYAGGHVTPVITNESITADNGPLPASFLFGFSSGTGGGTNVHEITCFKAAPITAAASSAGSNVQQSARVEAGSQVYLSYYHPLNSWGQMTASNLVTTTDGDVAIAAKANWDASCTLTGGTCSVTGANVTAQASAQRAILSWNGSTGIPFQYNSLATKEQTALGGATDGPKRVSYLRGDRSNERTPTGSGIYRKRDGILGDIVNSSPTWVGNPVSPYGDPGRDLLRTTNIPELGEPYKAFKATNQSRMHVVYTGANDGMVHGFRAGAFDAQDNFSTAVTPNDGKEVIAYMPKAVANSIRSSTTASLDFSSPQYAHNSYVDATPVAGDLYYQGAWHTWLIGGLGAGGNVTGAIANDTGTAVGNLYAIDITDPSRFSEANAASLVINEWSSENLACVNDTNCKGDFGSVYGTPLVRLMHDGNWAVIFGNGRNSATGTAGVYVMTVDRTTGAQTIRFLDTGAASTTNKNGIDFVTAVDLDGDHVTDYLYAGDLTGKLWRFNMTSSLPTGWSADAAPLFTTPAGQPISTRVTANAVLQKTGAQRLIISFGTGRQSPRTLTNAQTFASGSQAIYGIWDWDMNAWNAKSTVQYSSLSAPQSFTVADLTQQTVTSTAGGSNGLSGYRSLSQNPVCWKGMTLCANGNTRFGYRTVLPSSSEQVVYSPVVAYNTLFINTSIPAITQTLSCDTQPASGFTMALSLESGGAPSSSLFATAAKNAGITSTAVIAGVGLSATGTPSIVTAGGVPFLVQQTVSGVGTVTRIDPPSNRLGKRLTWAKLR